MPYLAGDNMLNEDYLTSTFGTVNPTSYFFLQQWASGLFTTGPRRPRGPGHDLDRGVLENCVGGAFSPGIEMTWICREPRIYSAPFRIKTRTLAPNQPLSPGQIGRAHV